MDVRNSTLVEPVVEHNGTTPVWYLVEPREMQTITDGGFLELVNEFEVRPGGRVDPHSHPTHEFYFMQTGRRDDHRGRGSRGRTRRSHLHSTGQSAQPSPLA